MRAKEQRPRERSEARRSDGRHRAGPEPVRPAYGLSQLTPKGVLRLQRLAGNAAVAELLRRQQPAAEPVRPSAVPEVLASSGRELAAPLRADMEGLLGADFSAVRVHEGAAAARAAAEVGASAFTSGDHVVIGTGGSDRRTLAHELTHVIQQRSGPVAGTARDDGLWISDPSDRFERAAEATAARVTGGSPSPSRDGGESAEGTPAAGAPGSATIQRTVTIKFEQPSHELDKFYPAAAKINFVEATRSNHPVAVENKFPAQMQRAHVTADTVFQNMLVRLLEGKTYVEAWQALKAQFQFLGSLLRRWYEHPGWQGKDRTGSKAVAEQLPKLIEEKIAECDAALSRGGFPITGTLYGARPEDGDGNSWTWYNHYPTVGEADPATSVIRKWKLRLESNLVQKLQEACDSWVKLRAIFPWTSIDADSHNSSDRAGPGLVEAGVADAALAVGAGGGVPGIQKIVPICDAMLKTFDFYPPSLTAARTIRLAAILAARHVVEHFQYHPSIPAEWRDTIAAEFVKHWKRQVEAETRRASPQQEEEEEEDTGQKRGEKRKQPERKEKKAGGKGKERAGKKRKTKQEKGPRSTEGLIALLHMWDDMEAVYLRAYRDLKSALTF